MSRCGYSYCDYDEWAAIMYRGAVKSAVRGARGQKALVDLVEALDAMPEKRLARNTFGNKCGVCALGAVARHRGVDLADLEPDLGDDPAGADPDYVDAIDSAKLGERLDIAESMAREVMWHNDDAYDNSQRCQEMRWSSMRKWALRNMLKANRERFEPDGESGE